MNKPTNATSTTGSNKKYPTIADTVTLARLSTLALACTLYLNEDIRIYCDSPCAINTNALAVDMKRAKDALEALEQEMQKQGM